MYICFVLPRMETKPIGGYKVVYEYVNRLVARNYDVAMLYLNTNYLKRYKVPKFFKKAYFDILQCTKSQWFYLDNRVKKISDYSQNKVADIHEKADYVVATAVNTAKYVAENFQTKNKIYLIQGRETWSSLSEKDVDETYRLGMKNVVVSQWLKDIVDKTAECESILIQNPIDTEKYRVINPIKNRKKYTIGCLYNPNPCKGFDNAYNVIMKLKAIYPEMEVIIFGAYKKPHYLPTWVKYVKKASTEKTIDIYNSISVFLCSTIEEGYGLTGLEAMACGCALCSTDYGAVHEYANNEVNCLLSPVSDIDAQVRNVSRLFDDNDLRIKIAENAVNSVNRFSWDIAINKFIALLKE